MPENIGKTIRLYLADGIPTGILTAEIINWTGKVIVAPRTRLAELATRLESRRTGVYLLIGPDPEAASKDRVYVGEGDNVLTRLTSHDRDDSKDFFTRIVVISSKDENLTKSHVRYLESRLIQMCNDAGRASVANGNYPAAPPMPEPDVADMEFFLEQIQMILPVLGFPFLQSKPSASTRSPTTSESPTFEMRVAGTHARAVEIEGEMVVLKGSTARKEGVPSWTSFKSLRDQLVADGKLIDTNDDEYYEFVDDTTFSSPSAAAAVVAGRNTNGRITWRIDGGGATYADWNEARLQRVDIGNEAD